MNSNIHRLQLNSKQELITPDGSLSDQIRDKLSLLAAKSGKIFFIENQGSPIEIYHYGSQSARLIRRLHQACVGERGGVVRYYAESIERDRFEWWRQVLEGLPIFYLDLPIDDIAREMQVVNPEHYFSPQEVIRHYQFNPNNYQDLEIACQQWIQDNVIEILNPLLEPDFKVCFLEDRFRLIPLNYSLIYDDRSHFIQSDLFSKCKKAISDAIVSLSINYDKMSQQLRTTKTSVK
ncbi:MAG: hypothetical protein ACH350_03325 [Parachlamydiaceae bacterium]